ncbi:MAG: hypothetical protein ACRERC_25405 [Candidatus Binatia bacterium]
MKTLIVAIALTAVTSASSAAAQCCGDCAGDGTVSIADLIVAVNNALGGCGITTATPVRTATPTRKPTATRTPSDRCPSTFADTGTNQCTFRGLYNEGCGLQVDATFSSNGNTIIVTVATGIPNPPIVSFSAVLDTATRANLTAWSTDNFQHTNLTAGALQLNDNRRELVIFPNDPPFMIQGCNFVRYLGDYLEPDNLSATNAIALDAGAFDRVESRPTPRPPELSHTGE